MHFKYLHTKDGPDALPADEKSLLVSRDPFETLKNLWTFALEKKTMADQWPKRLGDAAGQGNLKLTRQSYGG